jgi:prepilin-type N-terminal cleavage/methylation domain-containing protein
MSRAMKMNEKKNSWTGGVTLIELVMVITIVGVLAGASAMYIKETIDLWRFLSFRSEVVAQGRTALIRMEREIRQAVSVSVASANQLQFTKIGDISSTTFQLTGGNLMRNSDILAANVQSLKFCYYKNYKSPNNNQPVCSPECACSVSGSDLANIYRIVIELKITSGGQSNTLKSQVYPRNF